MKPLLLLTALLAGCATRYSGETITRPVRGEIEHARGASLETTRHLNTIDYKAQRAFQMLMLL